MTHFNKFTDTILKEKSKAGRKAIRFTEIKGDYKFKLDNTLKSKLDTLISDLKQNDDALIVIVAPEGAGKTVFETQIAYYCSQQLKVSWGVPNVHFDGQTYMNFSLENARYNIVALDESRRALNKMRASSSSNVDFMNFLSECRSQNQIHIIVLPAFTDLEQYVAIHRVKLLLSVEKRRDPKTNLLIRGNFNIWSTKKKWLLKKAWDGKYKEFPNSMRIHSGKFEDMLCLDEKEYNKKKEDAKKERYMEKDTTKKKDTDDSIDKLILKHNEKELSLRQIGSMVGKGKDYVSKIIKENNKEYAKQMSVSLRNNPY